MIYNDPKYWPEGKWLWYKYTIVNVPNITSSNESNVANFWPNSLVYYMDTPKPSADGLTFDTSLKTSAQNYIENVSIDYPYFGDPTGTFGDDNNCFHSSGYTITEGIGIYSLKYDKKYTLTSSQGRGNLIGKVYSNDENAYPDNGIQGEYWYTKVTMHSGGNSPD